MYLFTVISTFLLFIIFIDAELLVLDNVHSYKDTIKLYVDKHSIISKILYCIVFIIIVAFALPLTATLVLISGYLFGYFGLIIAIVSMVAGSIITYYSLQIITDSLLKKRAMPYLQISREYFKKNELLYLTCLRMFPLVPFPVVTAIAGVSGVNIGTFFVATLLGSLPACFALIVFGKKMDGFIEGNESFTVSILISPEFLIALSIILCLFIIPMLLKGKFIVR